MTTITELSHRLVIGALALGASAFSAALTGGASKRAFLSRLLIMGLSMLGTQIVGATDKFLLLNYSPNGFSTYPSSATIMNYVAQKFGAGQSSLRAEGGRGLHLLSRGLGRVSELALMPNDLARAQSLGIPILVQVDTENWLPASLLNWYDPGLAGYDPAKTADVEWYGWDQTTRSNFLAQLGLSVPDRTGPQFVEPQFSGA